jgi:CheY-like chemotaxis protein
MSKKNILIIEDEYLFALSLQLSLIESGYSVCEIFNSGESAVDYIKRNKAPDLLIVDNQLTGAMSGIEAVRKIYNYYHIPAIYITGIPPNEIFSLTKDMNPVACFDKPLYISNLIDAIDDFFHIIRTEY